MYKRVLVFLNGDYKNIDFYRNYIRKRDYLICADGALNFLLRIGVKPDLVVGDMDSIDTESTKWLKKSKVRVERFRPDKDCTDSQLALDRAVSLSPKEIVVLGAFGSRRDHELATLFSLEKYAHAGIEISLVDEDRTILIARKRAIIEAPKGATVSLIPLTKTVSGITTSGLLYSLKNGTLRRQQNIGISNVITNRKAEVRFSKGTLIIVVNKNL